MDLTQNVKVVISADAKPIQQTQKQVEQQMGQHQNRISSIAAKGGQTAGDQFGRSFNRAHDRWMKIMEGSVRRYGGVVGGFLGDMLGNIDKIGKAMESNTRGARGAGGNLSFGQLVLSNLIGNSSSIKGFLKGVLDPVKVLKQMSQMSNPDVLDRWARMKAKREFKANPKVDPEALAESMIKQYNWVTKYAPMINRFATGAITGAAGVLGGAGITFAGGVAWKEFMDSQNEQIKNSQKIVANYQKLAAVLQTIGTRSEKIRFLQGELGSDYSSAYAELQRQANVEKWKLDNSRGWTTLSERTSKFWESGFGNRMLTAGKQAIGGLLIGDMSNRPTPESRLLDGKLSEEKLRAVREFKLAETVRISDQNMAATEHSAERIPMLEKYNIMRHTVVPELAKQFINSPPELMQRNRLLLEKAKAEKRAMVGPLSQLGSQYVDAIMAKNPRAYNRKGYVSDLDYLLGNIPVNDPLNPQKTDAEILQREANRIRRESGMSASEIAYSRATHSKDIEYQNKSFTRVKALLDSRIAIGKEGSFRQQIKTAQQLQQMQVDQKRANFLEQLSKVWEENGGAIPIIPRNGK